MISNKNSDDVVLNLSQQLLVMHDQEIGLKAIIWQREAQIRELQNQLAHMKDSYENSTSWRLGRILLSPKRFAQKIKHSLRKMISN